MFTDTDSWWGKQVSFGPWFTCAKEFKYDVYGVWEEPERTGEDLYTVTTSCWSTLSK